MKDIIIIESKVGQGGGGGKVGNRIKGRYGEVGS